MASVFPNGIDSFTRKAQGETVQSTHVNELQQAVENIESRIGIGTIPFNLNLTSLITATEDPGHTHTKAFVEDLHENDIGRETPVFGRLAGDESVTGSWNYLDTLTISKGADTTGLLLTNSNFILNNGRLGLGTETPPQKLSISNGLLFITGSTLSVSPSGGSGLFLGASESSGEVEGRIQVRSISDGSSLTVHTSSNGDDSKERLRITPEGYIGINCTPLSARLQFQAVTGLRTRSVIWRFDSDFDKDLLFCFQRGTFDKNSLIGVPAGTVLSRIVSEGWAGGSDDENYEVGAELRTVTVPNSTNWTSLDLGTSFEFHTCAQNAKILTKRVTISSNGNIIVGTNRTETESFHQLDLSGSSIRIGSSNTIEHNHSSGQVGTICWDTNYIYVCVATNTWKRLAFANNNW